jgi:hypothetical protein
MMMDRRLTWHRGLSVGLRRTGQEQLAETLVWRLQAAARP